MILTEYDEDFNNKTWYEDGVADGISQGITQGEQKKAVETAENLLKIGIGTVEQISQVTKLPIEQIIELQNKVVAKA